MRKLTRNGCYGRNNTWEWSRYNWSILQAHQWQTFFQVFKPAYDDMLGVYTGKPLMEAEIGGNKAAWISDAYANSIPNVFPAIKAVQRDPFFSCQNCNFF